MAILHSSNRTTVDLRQEITGLHLLRDMEGPHPKGTLPRTATRMTFIPLD